MRPIPEPDDYYQTNKEYSDAHRSAWPIDVDSGLSFTQDVTVNPGDLVSWIDHPDNDMSRGKLLALRSMFYMNKTVGIVLRVRWRRLIVSAYPDEPERECVYPEALVLWEDGGTTDTSHSMLKQLENEL
jgi:hypothetical protein